MRKISIALLGLTMCFSHIILAGDNTSAMYKAPDATWWTVQELLDFKEQTKQEEFEICGQNQSCKEELFFTNLESEDTRYQALEMMLQSRFVVTSINPGQEKIKVIYFDEDPMLKRMGIEEHDPLNHIFMAWFNQDNSAITNYSYQYPYQNQFPDDIHLLYIGDKESFGNGSFPSNQEFELPIHQTGLVDNHLASIKVATFANQYNSMGQANYLSCIREPDYAVGVECRMMYSAEQGPRYFPPRETIEQIQSTSDTSPVEEPTILTLETSDNSQISTSEDNFSELVSTSPRNENELTNTMKAPETGTFTNECNKVIEFPWWLALLLMLGNATLLWLFWPKNQKNS
ncbi:hypothetical protein IJG12_03745 [Candidatus Saccharibacteria bacterium]|nr:hypothetical protein [Candidatus Saccharibacteria bacterium]